MPCNAYDHSQVKQVYVPASHIPRRYDNEMFFGDLADPVSNPAQTKSTAATVHSAVNQAHQAAKSVPIKKVAKPSIYKKASDPFVQVTGAQFQADTAIKHADTLIAQGKLKDAQALLLKVQKTFPQQPKLHDKISQVSVLRSHHYLKTGDHNSAASQSRLALAFDHDNEKAKESLDRALQNMNIDPKSSTARLKQGHVLFSQGKTLEAAIEYRAALHSPLQDNSHAEALVGLGNIAVHHKDLVNAKANYEAALTQNPNSASAYRQYGILQYKQNELIKANRNLSKALIVNPNDGAAKEKLIELWQHQVMARPNDAVTHLGMARAYQLSGDLKSAQTEYKTVVRLDPNHPNLPQARESFKIALAEQEARKHLEAAHSLENNNALREAFVKANDAARISPASTKIKLYQAHLAEKLNNYREAKGFYLSVLSQEPNNAVAIAGVKKFANILGPNEHPIELKAQAGAMDASAQNFDSFNSGRRIEGPRNWSLGVPPNRPHRFTGTEEPPLATLPAFPMTASGAPASGLSTAQFAPGQTGPGSVYQIPSGDPLTNMSGFMTQLRNHMQTEKQKWKDWEEQVHSSIKPQAAPSAATSSPSSASSLLSSSPGAASSTTAPSPIASAMSSATTSPTGSKLITSGDVANLLKSLKVGKTTPVATAATTPVASALQSTPTASNLASTVATTASAMTNSAPPLAPPIQNKSTVANAINALATAATGRPILPYSANPYTLNPAGYPVTPTYNPYTGAPIPFVTQGPPQIDPLTGKALPTNLTVPTQIPGQIQTQVPGGAMPMQTTNGTNWTALAMQAGQVIAANKSTIKAVASNAAQKAQPYLNNLANSLQQPSTSTSETTKAKLLPTTAEDVPPNISTTTNEATPTMEALSQASVPQEIAPSITKASDENAIALAAPDSLTSQPSQTQDQSELISSSSANNEVNQRINNLENQNSQLREQLERAQAQLKSRNGKSPNNSSPAYISPLGAAPVRLELLGVSSTEKTTTLNVVLRNSSKEPMKFPSSMRAVVRLYGTKDQIAKVKFDKKSLSANETVKGTIQVQAPKLSPAADVLIPNMMTLDDGSKQDLHLTVPISSTFGGTN